MHLFGLLTVVAGILWYATTQVGVESCTIEIIELDTQTREDNLVVWEKVHFRYLSPDWLTDFSIVLVLKPTLAPRHLEIGDQFRFRFRESHVFGMEPQNPETLALAELSLGPQDVEERIAERVWEQE